MDYELTEERREYLIEQVIDEVAREYLKVQTSLGVQNLRELLKFHYPIGMGSLEKIEDSVSASSTPSQFIDALNRYRWGYFTLFDNLKKLYGGGK